MNIRLIISSTIITILGLVFITEFLGRRRSAPIKKIVEFLAIAPFLSILIRLLLSMVSDFDNAGKASSVAAEEMITMLPETILSAVIGEVVGFVIWRIYRWLKR